MSSDMFEYENQLFLEMFKENALLVLCKGLGLERILLNFLHLYCDLKELVFILNTDQEQQLYFMDKLKSRKIAKLPGILLSDVGAQERKLLYSKGGVFFASSRILLMDFLVDRVPVHLVSGIIVMKAHKMAEATMEPFILRLYRQKNKDGFIKAFTDNPVSLVGGYSKMEKVMKNLFVGKIFLWPRFHTDVIACLDKHKPEVIEISVELTSSMRSIQTALLEILSACLKELKASNPGLDTDDFTVEKSLGKSFDRSVRAQLDPIWNQLGSKTKQLVADLRTLRLLLQALSQYDCVTFLHMLETSSGNQKAFGKNPGWIFLNAADSLFLQARHRVYGDRSAKMPTKNVKKSEAGGEDSGENLFLEVSPKWNVLTEILEEIDEANKKTAASSLGLGKVMICAGDMRGMQMLRDYLTSGARATLLKIFNKTFKKNYSVTDKKDRPTTSGSTTQTLTQMFSNSASTSEQEVAETSSTDKPTKHNSSKPSISGELEAVENIPHGGKLARMKVMDSPETYLHALFGNPDPYSLTRTLEIVEPRFVVLYDCSVHFVRQLEVYKACHPGMPLRIYFLTFRSSAEEQVYLTSLRREKEAFLTLIREKSSMVVPKEREGKHEDDPQLQRSVAPAYEIGSSTRKAGGQSSSQADVIQTVIVDMREFRSELPSLLHKRGIEIEPLTLEVGDYIITPEICIERKSISDLIGSLNSGRLYSQCVAMTRHYKTPMLLIEFDANKAFSFQARGTAGAKVTLKELNQKLALLLLHFPGLRLAWCSSPEAAAQLMDELKTSRKQPDPGVAAAAGSEDGEADREEKYNAGPHDFLLQLPGLNTKNYRQVLHHVKNLRELCHLSEDQLATLLDSRANASQLHEFLHKKYEVSSVLSSKSTMATKPKRPFGGPAQKKLFTKRGKQS